MHALKERLDALVATTARCTEEMSGLKESMKHRHSAGMQASAYRTSSGGGGGSSSGSSPPHARAQPPPSAEPTAAASRSGGSPSREAPPARNRYVQGVGGAVATGQGTTGAGESHSLICDTGQPILEVSYCVCSVLAGGTEELTLGAPAPRFLQPCLQQRAPAESGPHCLLEVRCPSLPPCFPSLSLAFPSLPLPSTVHDSKVLLRLPLHTDITHHCPPAPLVQELRRQPQPRAFIAVPEQPQRYRYAGTGAAYARCAAAGRI